MTKERRQDLKTQPVPAMEFRDFVGYLFLVSALGKPPESRRRREREGKSLVGEALLRLSREPLASGRLEFDGERRVLRVRRKSLVTILEGVVAPRTAERFFHQAKTFFERTKRFVAADDRFRQWRDGGARGPVPDLVGDLTKDRDYPRWREIVGPRAAGTVSFAGVPVVGYRGEEWVWIGLAPSEAFAELCRNSSGDRYPAPEDVADYLQPTDVRRARVPPGLTWLAQTGDPESDLQALAVDKARFKALCGGIFGAIVHVADERSAEAKAFLVQLFGESALNGDGSRCFIAVPGSEDPEEVLRQLQDGMADLGTSVSTPTQVVICTAMAAGEPGMLAIEETLRRSGRRVVLLDGPSLLDCLSYFPWVWSEHLAADSSVGIALSSSAEGLARVLFASGPEVPNLPLDHSCIHTALPAWAFKEGARIRVVGRRGAGKTSSLFLMLQADPRERVVIVVKLGGSPPVSLLASVVESLLLEDWQNPIVVIFEDLQREGGRDASRTGLVMFLFELERLCKKYSTADVSLAVTYRSCDRRLVRETYGELFLHAGFSDEIVLDSPEEAFLGALVDRCAVHFGVPVLPADRDGVIQSFMARARMPAAVIESFHFCREHKKDLAIPQRSVRPFIVDDAHWRQRVPTLATRPNPDLLSVLQVLSLLRLASRPLTRRSVGPIFYGWYGGTGARLQRALSELADEAWVWLEGEKIYCDDVQIEPHALGWCDEEQLHPTTLFDDVCEWIKGSQTVEADDRDAILFRRGLVGNWPRLT